MIDVFKRLFKPSNWQRNLHLNNLPSFYSQIYIMSNKAIVSTIAIITLVSYLSKAASLPSNNDFGKRNCTNKSRDIK